MEKDAFEQSLKAFTRRTPFHPFLVELVSGGQLLVDHPEALVLRHSIAVHFNPEGFPTMFDHQGVTRLVEVAEGSSNS